MNSDKRIEKLASFGFNTDAALERFIGDSELYLLCLTSFLEDKNYAVLLESSVTQNREREFAAAHTLKGVSGNLGMTALYEAVCVLLEELRVNRYHDLPIMYRTLSQAYDAARAAIIAVGAEEEA